MPYSNVLQIRTLKRVYSSQEYVPQDLSETTGEPLPALVRAAKIAILYRCKREVRVQWNYLDRKNDTITHFVSGKWRLKRDALPLMKEIETTLSFSPGYDLYSLYERAFEDALKELLAAGLLIEEREYPRKTGFRRKFAITSTGLDLLRSNSHLIESVNGGVKS
jgi:hypothetical protein